AEFRTLAVLIVEVNLIGVVGQQGKPDIIRLRDGSPQTTTINIADFKVFEKAAFPARLHGHKSLPFYNARFALYTSGEIQEEVMDFKLTQVQLQIREEIRKVCKEFPDTYLREIGG